MANKDKLGDFYSTNNELGINSTMSFGNSSVNVSINSTSVVLSPSSSLSANGTIGTSGQVLTSNGTTVYWAAAAAGVNVNATYTWTNVHTFNANVILGSGLSANGSYGTSGQLLASNGSATYWTNPSTFIQQQYTANGTANSFAVTGGYTANQIMVFLNGVKQLAAVDVDLSSGANVGFITTPASGGLIDIYGYKAMAGGSNLGPAFHAYGNTATSVPINTFTKITLNAELYDTASCFDSTTNYRFTPNVSGYYQFSFLFTHLSGSISTNILPAIFKNGAEYIRGVDPASFTFATGGSGLVYLNGTTDYVELYLYQAYLNPATIGGGGSSASTHTYLTGFLARAA